MASDRPSLTAQPRPADPVDGHGRTSEKLFRALIEHSTDLVMLVDAQGSTLYASPALRVLGLGPDHFVGLNINDQVHPEDRQHVSAAFSRVVETPGGRTIAALRLAHADGYWLAVEASFSNLLHDPQVSAVVVNAREVTERVVAEEALQQSHQALLQAQAELLQAQKMEAIGRLAGGVAHDFNNLLAAILSGTELLLDRLPLENELREDVQDIKDVAQRGAALTRQLLTFSRKQALNPRLVDLNDAVRGLMRLLQRLIGSTVKLQSVLDPQLRHVRIDPTQLEQVVVNLVVNARDAMPVGGTIVIETANVAAINGSDRVTLTVRDTGTGMDEATLSSIFEPFFTTKEAGKGTGLGLATVYGIVTQSGGEIRVHSEVGRGTAFEIVLPAETGEAAALTRSPGEARVPVLPVNRTVLLVDDEVAVRNVLRKLLTRSGYTVLAAGDAKEALKLAESYLHSIDLLITDLNMPGMKGDALAKRLIEDRPGLQVLLMSGLADPHPQRSSGHALQFIEKPFENSALLQRVKSTLTP